MQQTNVPFKVALGYIIVAIVLILAIGLVYRNTTAVLAINQATRDYIEKRQAAGYLYPRAEYRKILLYGMAPEFSYRFRTGEEDVRIQRETPGYQHHQYGEQQCVDLCLRQVLSD
jgi:hypothetical protein